VTDLLDAWLHRGDPSFAHRPALATRTVGGWTELSYAALDRSSRRVAAWLAAREVGAGDRVAIVGEAGADWVIALFGAWRRGAIAIPVDARLGSDELGTILGRAQPSAVISSIPAQRVGPAPVNLRFDQIGDLGDGPDADCARGGADTAVVMWTSGTNGAPKGVTLTFANIAYVVDQSLAAHVLDPDDRWLSILALNHTLELSCGLLPALATGASFAFVGAATPSRVVAAMAERRFTRMTVVPLFLTALLDHIETESRTGRLRWAWYRSASAAARAWPSARARRLVFAPLHRRVGGAAPTFHCGGAPLDASVARRFERFGVPVYSGYGLTETAPTVAMNTPEACRHGSVGRPLPGTAVRIADDGEILVRSPGVMAGYWNDAALTATVIDDAGWLHTGDLGRLDPEGFLFVTGRTKSLIVLANAKKVQPEEVEAALAGSHLLAEACVVGWSSDGCEQVCAVVVAAPGLRERCPTPESLHAAATDEVARLTTRLASFKRPAVVLVVDGELPRTPKRSFRRAEVIRLLAASPRSGHVPPGQDTAKRDQNTEA